MLRSLRFLLVLLFVTTAASRLAADSAEVASLRAKAEKGNGLAMYNLGLAYAQGDGVPVQFPEAFAWLSLAGENGAVPGRALEEVLSSITDAQLAEGRTLANEYRAALKSRHTASQGILHKAVNRGFTMNNSSSTAAVEPAPVAAPAAATSSAPGSAVEPRVPVQDPPPAPKVDELTQLKSELAKANSVIAEQRVTIAKLQEDVRRLLRVSIVAGPVQRATSPGDGVHAVR